VVSEHTALIEVTDVARALVRIIAQVVMRDERAPYDLIAYVVGAIMAIGAHHLGARADPRRADVVLRTQIEIITGPLKGDMGAARVVLTAIVGAGVIVAAVRGPPSNALPLSAEIADGARVSVVTRPIEWVMVTTHLQLARIMGACVVIVARVSGSGATDPLFAIIVDRADLSVLARLALLGIADGTQPRDHVAVGAQAGVELARPKGALFIQGATRLDGLGERRLGEINAVGAPEA